MSMPRSIAWFIVHRLWSLSARLMAVVSSVPRARLSMYSCLRSRQRNHWPCSSFFRSLTPSTRSATVLPMVSHSQS